MPAPANTTDFAALIVRSRLLSPESLKAALRDFKPSGRDAQDVDAVRKTLVAGKHLTDYQAALLMRGLSEGFFLGPYRVLELIAKGRMAGVYKAAHESGQVVAIKVLPASKARDPETLARFQREAKLLTQLDHPNVVRAFQFGEANGTHYLALEHLDGDTLEDVLKERKSLPAAEAVGVMHQVLLALQHLHDRGMIHRDLKPANLMLLDGPAGNRPVKVLDIGLGKAVFEATQPGHDPTMRTADGVLIGTPDYLAPEQARKARTADIRSDIYAVGCVLYHALTGQVPFPDASILNQVMRHATEKPRPLSDFLSAVPAGLQETLDALMAKEPGRRPSTPAQAAQSLSRFVREAVPRASDTPNPAYERWLVESAKPAPSPNIPVGRLEAGSGRLPKPAIPVGKLETPAATVDVELVSVRPPREKRAWFEIDLRDVAMMVFGGVFVIVALALGWWIDDRLSMGPSRPQEEVEDGPPAQVKEKE